MPFGLLVHCKLFLLVLKLLCTRNIKRCQLYVSVIFTWLFKFCTGLWFFAKVKNLADNINKRKTKRKQAIVILSTISTLDYPPPVLTDKLGKQNAFFLERLMTEKLAHTLIELKSKLNEKNCELALFVCYQDRYFYKYNINDWLEHLPDYSRRLEPLQSIRHNIDSRFEQLKKTFDDKLKTLDLSFDADSFCSTKPKSCCGKSKGCFKYICVEDTEDGQAIEAATRVGFFHDNQDVLVLNPHAIEMSENHVIDSLAFLENSRGLKDRVIYGKTKRGGLYLLGVSRSRNTLLNIRRLTQDVFLNSNSGFSTLEDHLDNLKWSSACLKSVLDDVNDIESLPLLERELGLKMEDIPNDLISVVIPTYNHEEFIEETLESMTYHISGKRYIQVIVVDANSTDYTLKRVENFKQNIEKYANCSLINRNLMVTKVRRRKDVRQRRTSTNVFENYPRIDYGALVSIEVYSLPSSHCQNREEQVDYAVKNYVEGGTILIIRPGTNLSLYWDISVRRCLNRLGVILGTFSFNLFLHDRYIARKHMGWAIRSFFTSLIFNIRSKWFEMPSGDQTFFMYTFYYRLLTLPNKKKNIENHNSSFVDNNSSVHDHSSSGEDRCMPPVLDDVNLLDRVYAAGHVSTCDDIVTVCPIKAMRFGFCRCWLLDTLIIAAYRLGAPAEQLNQYCHQLIVVQPDYYDGY